MTSPASPARTGVWIGIATITMSFTAYLSALLFRQGSGTDWHHFRLPSILYFNTALLLASSGTLEGGRRRLRAAWATTMNGGPGSRAASPGIAWLSISLVLGLLFIAGQVVAWRDLASQGLFLATNPSSDFFYIFTALHALHLLGGVAALGYVVRRIHRVTTGPPVEALGAASLYWHFMDVLWLFLLLVLALRL